MVAPTGGAKDVTPPKAIEDKTIPKNLSINFNSKTILIPFDEYFRFSNPSQNVIITPSLPNKPEFKVKGKKLYIFLNNELDTNTTYTINFGSAISDVTENNIMKNYKYVFSTGAYLDSLKLKGNVRDAFTSTPTEDVWVMLYKNDYDSIPEKEKPYYFSKTDASGNFEITNIKNDNYKVFALKDGNSNFLYDNPSEDIAFTATLVNITHDSLKPISLSLFNEKKEKFLVSNSKFSENNAVSVVFNKAIKLLPKFEIENVFRYYFESGSDSCVFYLNDTTETKLSVPLYIEEYNFSDTLLLRRKTKMGALNFSIVKNGINLKDTLHLLFNYPIAEIDTSKMLIQKDSVDVSFNAFLNSKDERQIDVLLSNPEAAKYTINLLPKSVKNIYQKHNDTLVNSFSVLTDEHYSDLIFITKIDSIFSSLILEITDEKNNVIYHEKINSLEQKTVLKKLNPGSYSARIIVDENENGKWDTGNYYEKIQPEKIIYFSKKLSLRSNWEVNETWELKASTQSSPKERE